ncbi:hypothetical protein [Caloramator sp. mosi_1]|uniref:hypothetical protein n=1 Tax=Caloramator sp. mosi_1 TaxID=3023090 RepID=UPI003081BF50
MRWSLENLYTSFDSREFLEDNNKVLALIDELKEWSRENFKSLENAKEKIEFFLGKINELSSLIYKIAAYSELSLSVDAKTQRHLCILKRLKKLFQKQQNLM